MNVLIAVPSMDYVPATFCQSLAMLEKVGNCAVAFQVGSLVYKSRDALAKQALKMNADYVLWLDSDMSFPPDLLKRMLELDADFLTGVYYRRSHPYTPVILEELNITEEGRCVTKEFSKVPEDTFEVEGCGFGCVLMKTQVIYDVMAKFGAMFNPMDQMGEDLAFCYRARQCGYEILADPSIELGHYSHTVVTKSFFEAYKGDK